MPFQPTYDVPPERQPYHLEAAAPAGGRVGVLFLHGFMGSPLSSRGLAEYLAVHGVSVHCPLLPGHGHYPDKLGTADGRAWLAEAEEAFKTSSGMCD